MTLANIWFFLVALLLASSVMSAEVAGVKLEEQIQPGNLVLNGAGLRKRLRERAHVEVFDSFPPYGAAFRRRFGIAGEQALELFNQTVSMKSVGNLTDFVRQHMLEPFDMSDRIEALIGHFADLDRAHQAVVNVLDAARRADEQAAADLALYGLDAAGERGLAESERRCRARKAAVVGEGDHVTHVAEFERHLPNSTASMQAMHAGRPRSRLAA
jgi:hypothetical protein